MPYRQLITIPLPAGRTGPTWHLSLALVPRLQEHGTLADYNLDWARWPVIAGALGFNVFLNNALAPINPARVTIVSPPPDPALWEALFGTPPSAQRVTKYRFVDRRQPDFREFPSAEVVDGLRELYLTVADRFPETPPTPEQVLRLTAAEIVKGSTLLAAEDYLAPTSDPPVEQSDGPGLEFHELMTVLRAHPHLLRLLGLVVDFDVQLQPGAPLPDRVRVETNWAGLTGAAPRDECPLVMGLDSELWSRPRSPDEHVASYLRLSDAARYQMATTDLVSASQRLLDYQRTTLTSAATAPVPSPREAGVTVVHTDLAELLTRRFERQRELENQIDQWFTSGTNRQPQIGLEDVTSGYRYDILDAFDPTWRSVFERHTTDGYFFPRDPKLGIVPPDDEGRWTLALATEGDERYVAQRSGVEYTQEGGPNVKKREANDQSTWRLPIAAFRWNGWSAATPPPGSSLNGSGDATPPAANVGITDQAALLEVNYQPVPGTLPRLRYGHTYNVRARATDLAGNSKTVADPVPDDAVSAPATFRRTQPIGAPMVVRTVPKQTPGVGDTPATLVIKSEQDQPEEEIAPTDRHVYPPRISQARLELHGLPVGGVDPDSYRFLVKRDAKRLDDQVGVDPVTSDLVSGSFDSAGHHLPGPDRPPAEYLVDPAALSVTMAGAPGAPDPVVVAYGGAWPDPLAVHIELRAGSAPPVVSDPGAPVSVLLNMPPGRVQQMELSHAVDPAMIDQFEAFGGLSKKRQGELRALVELGRHHVISARTPLTLVHAVRVPVTAAGFSGADLVVGRQTGSRFGNVSGGITLDRPSTERIVLVGAWTDPVDDIALAAPTTRSYQADTAVIVDLDGEERTGVLDAATLDLVDTRRHTATLHMVAFSRFSRYFTEQIDDFVISSSAQSALLDGRGVVPRSVLIGADGVDLQLGTDYTVDRDTGTVTRTNGGNWDTGTAYTARYIPLPVSRTSLDEALGTATVVFPSAVRPSPPLVADVVPAASRLVTSDADHIVVDHDGRVLRVLLERPWFSSGEDERLAVLLDHDPAGIPVHTSWGRDPLVAGTGSLPTPGLEHFPAATETVTEGDIDVAAHAVRFDEERGLWAADIAIDADLGDRPFVRLALGRYQPVAVEGLALSPEVQPDPVRLGPRRQSLADRTATAGTVLCTMKFTPTEHVVQVRVQQADPNIADPDLRWSDVEGSGGPLVVTLTPDVADASVHAGPVELPNIEGEVRLVYEDLLPVTRTDSMTGEAVADLEVVYRETITVPAEWRA